MLTDSRTLMCRIDFRVTDKLSSGARKLKYVKVAGRRSRTTFQRLFSGLAV